MRRARTVPGRIGHLLPIVLRVIAVSITAYPAVRKFTEYPARVGAFASYGIPWPEVTVPLTGIVEVVAIVLIAVGFAGRLGAAMLGVGMVVVAMTAGANPFSVTVLVASGGVLVLGTGPCSLWDPSISALREGIRGRKETIR